MPLVDCERCHAPQYTEYFPARQPSRFKAGDIWAIFEKTKVPVYLILETDPASMSNPTFASATSWGMSSPTLDGKGSTSRWSYKPRPCIMMEDGATNSALGYRICLMATFDGTTRMEDLPEVLQRYCLPLFPHALGVPETPHIHATPEWPEERASWIIAWLYTTQSMLHGRWKNRASERPEDSSYRLDDEALAALTTACRQRRLQWETLCLQDVGTRERCL